MHEYDSNIIKNVPKYVPPRPSSAEHQHQGHSHNPANRILNVLRYWGLIAAREHCMRKPKGILSLTTK